MRKCLRGEPMYEFLMLCVLLTMGAVLFCDIKK
nr:MAG TPA_asm: 60S ribosomal subunit [Caudoviricetes sp.]